MANSFKPKREEIRRALNRLGFVGDYTKLGDIIMDLYDDIIAEVSDRKAADKDLQNAFEAHCTGEEHKHDAAQIEYQDPLGQMTEYLDVQAALDLLFTDKMTVMSKLNSLEHDIDLEKGARSEADSALESQIDAEATARKGVDENFKTGLEFERSGRVTEDEKLQAQIDELKAAIGSIEQSEVLKVAAIGTGLKLSENGTLSIDCATVSETSDAVSEKIGGA